MFKSPSECCKRDRQTDRQRQRVKLTKQFYKLSLTPHNHRAFFCITQELSMKDQHKHQQETLLKGGLSDNDQSCSNSRLSYLHHTHTYTHTHTRTHRHTHTHTRRNMGRESYIHTHTHTHMEEYRQRLYSQHTHTHTHTHKVINLVFYTQSTSKVTSGWHTFYHCILNIKNMYMPKLILHTVLSILTSWWYMYMDPSRMLHRLRCQILLMRFSLFLRRKPFFSLPWALFPCSWWRL